ncbi:MAG: sigma factor [Pirellulaceae bacterium]
MTRPEHTTDELLLRAVGGDSRAVNELLARHRDQLCRMVACHFDARLGARVDPSDVVQETFIAAAGSLAEYAQKLSMPFYPWLRRLASQRLIDLQRRHLSAQ